MKENRAKRLENILRAFGGKATLDELLHHIQTIDGGLSYKFTASVSELRKELALRTPSMTVVCHKGKRPGMNIYAIEQLLELFSEKAA